MGEQLAAQAYGELVERAADILMIVDESGEIRYENPAVERITGYSPAEREGESAFEHVHPDDRERARESFARARESTGDEIVGTEFRFRHKDGSWVWLESRGSVQTGTAFDGFVVSLRDISQRKAAEAALKEERDRLDRFTSVVSHDLRNPLTVIEGRLELARAECDSEHLEAAEESLERVNELVEDLLTLAREGNADPLLERVVLAEIAEQCWQNLETNDSTLDVRTEQTIRTDVGQAKQLLENLFRNAVEHGGDDVRIRIGALEDGFYVEDDGRGIPEDVRESLLEFGFTTKAAGTGFGLSIVNEIVDNHGWSLHVENGADGGARFEIRDVALA